MRTGIYNLLNIKPAEARVVKQLFLVQFFLGVGTSFLFTSALTLFLSTYPIKELPKVSLLAAGLLLGANYVYARLEARLSPKKLLQVIILFSVGSIVLTWLEATFFSVTWLPFFLSAWNMVLYMVMGYAFWGMAAIIFNVRESKRIFSVVGSGDIPAKILGYAAVAILAPVIGVINVLAISIIAFLFAYYYLNRFDHPVIIATPHHNHHAHTTKLNPSHSGEHASLINRLFENNLIFAIAIWSFIGFTIYSLLDYTFLTEIKAKYKTSHELASFLGLYFAIGRVLAMFIKLLFSSRVINRLGLANSLLVTPIILIVITGYILLFNNATDSLFVFGLMVLLSEVLKSTVQEPAFFVLFQPLHPHARLKGHLITKGYTMPFALLAVGLFAFAFRDARGEISIPLVCSTLVGLIAVWSAVVFLIKKEYLHTLIQAIKKGYFTGTQLFLSDKPVRELLLAKIQSKKPKEVLFSLELLERSGYKQLDQVLLRELNSTFVLIKIYVLSRITHHNITSALPLVSQQLEANNQPEIIPDLIRALFYLSPEQAPEKYKFKYLEPASKKAALLGLASRPEPAILQVVEQEVRELISGNQTEDRLLALDIISAAPYGDFQVHLQRLLQNSSPVIFKKAMETVGQVRAYGLWPELLQTAAKQNTMGALQRAISYFGDAIFAPEYLADLPTSFIPTFIKTAGTVTGNLSTNYLLPYLQTGNETRDIALAALYRKKADLTDSGKKEVTAWLENKLEQTKGKITISNQLASGPAVALLTTALKSEIKQDVQFILQACAMLYDRPHVERIMQLVKSQDDSRIFNAIEMLELNIPKRYFMQLDALLEYSLEIHPAPTSNIAPDDSLVTATITKILTAPETDFNVWTKSVALYLIPALQDKALKQILTEPLTEENNPLWRETKKFVISQVEL